ncbi:MAG: hypothetical protein IPL65_13500 [Lewinellaceae bacterium]|nr:hypothetical protein [Lewinellaceae bacterium]
MKKFFLALFVAFLGSMSLQAQIVYEDFEGATSNLPWAAPGNGYNGVIANPDMSGINTSAKVGSYTKEQGVGYSLFWAIDLAPLDISEYNQFKLKVWCSTATPVLLKFESTTGQNVEKNVTMPAAGQWVDLDFDMSAGANLTNLTRIIIFFDPGNDPSNNTYYFDDLVATKAQRIIEDWESPSGNTWISLNGTYDGPLANPDATGINTTATVGSFPTTQLPITTLPLAPCQQHLTCRFTTNSTSASGRLPLRRCSSKLKAVGNRWKK